jgi:hypothetical protein
MTAETHTSTLTVRYGTPQAGLNPGAAPILSVPLPLLHGQPDHRLHVPDATESWHGPIYLLENATSIIGAVVLEIPDRMEQPVNDIFSTLIDICMEKKVHLHRIWNFVPRINEFYQGLERYRQFNIGRWLAFERRFGRDLRSYMPAASAVGVPGDSFVLYFKAGRSQPLYFENPSQVPAYHYPTEYGPRPPGFARGVVVQKKNRRTAYLSGTASIEGHRSIGEGDWHAQFRTTLHNMEIMFDRMELPEALRPADPEAEMIREFKCYLRHPEALPLVREWFEEQTGIKAPEIMYLQSDICRAELDIEIEGSVSLKHEALDD